MDRDVSSMSIDQTTSKGNESVDPNAAMEGTATPVRRKSTLLLTDDIEFDKLKLSNMDQNVNTTKDEDGDLDLDSDSEKLLSKVNSGEEIVVEDEDSARPVGDIIVDDQNEGTQPSAPPADTTAATGQQTAPQQDSIAPEVAQTTAQNAVPQNAPPMSESLSQESRGGPTGGARQPSLYPTEIRWVQGGKKVYVTGSFTGWRKMIKMVPCGDGTFAIKLNLPYGTHRFRFVVDNELRFSDYIPTATDQTGHFVNYVEVVPGAPQPSAEEAAGKEKPETRPSASRKDSGIGSHLAEEDDDMGNGYSRFHEDEGLVKPAYTYTNVIPPVFTDPAVMEQYYLSLDSANSSNTHLIPPALPPHLESVILNHYSGDKDNNSGALPIPNHVVLNHLATTSIKHNTLAVASIVRYGRKYATQILYAPLQ